MTPTPPQVGQGHVQGVGTAPASQLAQFRSDGFTAATGLRVPFFSESFARAYGLPETRLVNMLSEATPLREERPYVPLVGLREIRYSRPGLVTGTTQGTGPIRGLFQQDGLFGGQTFQVSGTTLYLGSAALGSIPGVDKVRCAFSYSQAVFVSSGVAYLYDGVNFGPIVSAVLPPVSDVVFLGGVFVYGVLGSDRFYFSAVNDAATIGGLNFETAESAPDPTIALAVLNDELVALGTHTVQFFSLSGDASAPFTPVEGRGFQRGCASRDAICFADNALFWVGENRVVYRVADRPGRISSNGIEDKLRQCANIGALTAFVATFEGHELYVLNIPGIGSYAYDISRIGTTISTYGDSYSRGEWDEWTSYGRTQFRGWTAISVGGTVFVGDDTTNDVGTMQMGAYSDYGGTLERRASAFIKVEEGNPRCLNLVLQCVMGVGAAVDPGSKPVAEMRYSDDLGRTFSRWRQAGLGAVGKYRHPRALWQRLGYLRSPGRLVEVRVTDPVNTVFSHLELNASRPAW